MKLTPKQRLTLDMMARGRSLIWGSDWKGHRLTSLSFYPYTTVPKGTVDALLRKGAIRIYWQNGANPEEFTRRSYCLTDDGLRAVVKELRDG